MARPVEVDLEPQPISQYRGLMGGDFVAIEPVLAEAGGKVSNKTVWNVNSTANGGGVAEMIRAYVPYLEDVGLDARWLVLQENAAFFALTKRIHNNLHGSHGDGGPLGESEADFYRNSLVESQTYLRWLISPGDVVILHDPQTAGLVSGLKEHGAHVIWRCHVGMDEANGLASTAMEFLTPFVRDADLCVFSREEYVWPDISSYVVIPPGIDAFTVKNRDLEDSVRDSILSTIKFTDTPGAPAPPVFWDRDGSRVEVTANAQVIQAAPLPPDVPLVAQISRWDRLKDHLGLLTLFSENVQNQRAHLALVGPDSSNVDDDPEGARVFSQVLSHYLSLPDETRSRIHLLSLPQHDLNESALMVNAIQRRADVVVQKSIEEGFGLTVTEAMWKRRPVVATRVGGIQDQIASGKSGILVDDPLDFSAFAAAIDNLLADEPLRTSVGKEARRTVCNNFLAPTKIISIVEMIRSISTEFD